MKTIHNPYYLLPATQLPISPFHFIPYWREGHVLNFPGLNERASEGSGNQFQLKGNLWPTLNLF